MKTVRLGRAFHIRTNRRCVVDLVNQSKGECFVYWDDGTPHGDYARIDELRNSYNEQDQLVFRAKRIPEFSSRTMTAKRRLD